MDSLTHIAKMTIGAQRAENVMFSLVSCHKRIVHAQNMGGVSSLPHADAPGHQCGGFSQWLEIPLRLQRRRQRGSSVDTVGSAKRKTSSSPTKFDNEIMYTI